MASSESPVSASSSSDGDSKRLILEGKKRVTPKERGQLQNAEAMRLVQKAAQACESLRNYVDNHKLTGLGLDRVLAVHKDIIHESNNFHNRAILDLAHGHKKRKIYVHAEKQCYHTCAPTACCHPWIDLRQEWNEVDDVESEVDDVE